MNSRRVHKQISCIDKGCRFVGVAALTISIGWLSGCGSTPVREELVVAPDIEQAYLSDKPAALQSQYRKVLRQGERNLVLNHMDAGLAALDMGFYPTAEHSFDEALNGIEKVYANDESAAKARSLWHAEDTKVFKGEPYERCMAYYYRGLLYMRMGDYENARASFKGGLLQDAFAEEDQNRADFALLIFLQGWASQMLGDHALMQDAYDEVKRLRPDFVMPPEDHDTLVLIETGKSPRKLSDGVGHYEMVYRPGRKFKEKKASINYVGVQKQSYPMEDIYYQATTRGGRAVDRIIKGKVEFKQSTEKFGSVVGGLADSSSGIASITGSDSASNASLALGLVSIVSLAASANARTEADTRYWQNLPDVVHIATLKSQKGMDAVTVQFQDKDGAAIDGMQKTSTIHIDSKGKGLAWVRSRPAKLAKR